MEAVVEQVAEGIWVALEAELQQDAIAVHVVVVVAPVFLQA
jgi:hypothetical protein